VRIANAHCCVATKNILQRNSGHISWADNLPRRIAVKKISSAIVAVIAIMIAGGTSSFAAELPSYEVQGLPISPVQIGLLGGANVHEQSQAAPSAASPHQINVLTPRPKVRAAAASPRQTEAGPASR
jgi:hypothetical protein